MRICLSLLILAMLSGCASVELLKVPPKKVASLQGGQLETIVYKEPPAFVALTPGSAMFGMLGAMVAMGNGKDIISDNKIADPAHAIAEELSPFYQKAFHASGPGATPDYSMSDSIDSLAANADHKGIIFDVQTTGWGMHYFATSWGHYAVTYGVRARLIDAASSALIGQVPCRYVSDSEDTSATYDELMADQAALLKKKLAAAADACIKIIKEKMLSTQSLVTGT